MPFTRNRGPGIHCRGNLINLRCKTKYSNQQSPVNGLTLNIWCAYKYSPFAPKLFHPWGQHLASTCWPVNSWSYSNEGRHHGLLHAPERKPMCCHHDRTSWRWWNIPSQQPTFPQLPDTQCLFFPLSFHRRFARRETNVELHGSWCTKDWKNFKERPNQCRNGAKII